MNKTLKQLTNIGIPVYNDIKLPLFDMTLECADDKQKSIGIERNIRREAIERVDNLLSNKSASKYKSDIDTINFFANDNSTSVFDISKEERFTKIFSHLTDLENTPSDKKIITTEEELERLRERVDFIKRNPYSTEFHNSLKKYFPLIYNGREYGADLRKYIENEYNYYLEKIERRKELVRIDYSDLMEEYTDSLIPEKTALYVAYQYLEEIKDAMITNDISKIQECLFYLTAFLKNKIDKNIKINLGKEINYDYIKKEYEDLLRNYSELRELYYRRSFFENKDKEDNLKVIDSLVNMEMVYVKNSFVKPGPELNIKVKDGTHRRRNNPPTEEELQEIQEYLDYKKYVFLKNNPIAQIICPNKFSNYVAFLYENGMMPADRFHNVNTIEQMKADSIYVFNALSFEEMIQYNKQYLRQHMDQKPLNHSGDWEGRVERIATQETSQEMRDKAKQMIKKKTN